MSTQPLVRPPPVRLARLEYLDFQKNAEHREFRFRVHGSEGWTETRVRIAIADFGTGRVRLQDGPDVCYQKLQRTVAASETGTADVITVDDVDVASYLEAHPQTKRQSWAPSTPPTEASMLRKRSKTPPSPVPSRASRPTTDGALEEGQRVSHAVYGVGVTSASTGDHTVVRFDADGPKTFVTSMLKVEVLSAPHTWETGPRGKNRPCRTSIDD
jgi:hypothetical protein